MQISPKGKAYIRGHENDVLKAYLCPAGHWTIGVGLTKASGVVDPKPGMTITREESERLFSTALRRNYEPDVAEAMPNAAQHAFDAGGSFHFNTGAIKRASWVTKWRDRAASVDIRAAFTQWNKGGGRVLPGLVRRRREEFDILMSDRWPAHLKLDGEPIQKATVATAGFAIDMDAAEKQRVVDALKTLGHDPGTIPGQIRLEAVTGFQRAHDLTVDGLIGSATLSAIERELAARAKAKPAAGAGAGGGVAAGGGEVAVPDPATADLVFWAGMAVMALAAVYGLWLAWRYRDVVAARVQTIAPWLARFLRRF